MSEIAGEGLDRSRIHSRLHVRRNPPALALVAAGAVCVQVGAALATHLFARVGPAGAVTLRATLGAAVLVVVARPGVRARRRRDLGVAAVFGLFLAAMNLAFYESIARIPLGVAVTVEFSGPLAVALIGSRRARDVVWAALAASGVIVLALSDHHTGGRSLDRAGIGLALVAGACWAGYIVLSKETGRRLAGLDGLALAMVVSAAALAPFGLTGAGSRLFQPGPLAIGLGVALLSSVVPYSLELVALRRVTPRAFGVLLSLDPAVAAVAGLVILGQQLAWTEVLALVLVVAANLGSIWFAVTRAGSPPVS